MSDTLTELINCQCPTFPPYGLLVWGSDNPPIPSTRTLAAVIAIAEAQRVNRANCYVLSGLCEFHIGIIYMHWSDFSAAQQQFVLARRYWRFSRGKTAVFQLESEESKNASDSGKPAETYEMRPNFPQIISLTYFAEGYAQEQAFAYEAALSAYRRAESYLPKTTEIFQDDCIPELRTVLNTRKKHIHKQLFASLTNTSPSSGSETHQTNSNATTKQSDNSQPSDDTCPPASQQADVPMPLFKMDKRPFSSLSPVPDHTNNGSYRWYSVHNIGNDAFLDIQVNSYLLIDTKHADKYNEDEWLLIKNDQEGSITLRPYPPKAPFERIYLTKVIQVGTFKHGLFSGKVKFSPTSEKNNIKQLDIIGIVIGMWRMRVT